MAHTINYQITNLEVAASLDDYTDVVTEIFFNITVTDDGVSSSYTGSIPITLSDTFADFESITHDNVVSWLKNNLWQGPNTEDIHVQQHLDIIQQLKNPTTVKKLPNSWTQ